MLQLDIGLLTGFMKAQGNVEGGLQDTEKTQTYTNHSANSQYCLINVTHMNTHEHT